MSAVAAPPITDTIISGPPEYVTYAARREGLVLVHTPEYPIRGPQGQQVGLTEGVRIPFVQSILRVPLVGDVRTAQGRKFSAAELNEWLQAHPKFGDPFEGFTKIEQVAPAMSDAEADAISEAAVIHDTDRLRAIVEAERAGWGRASVISLAERRIDQIETVQEQVRAQVEAEAAAEAAKAKQAK